MKGLCLAALAVASGAMFPPQVSASGIPSSPVVEGSEIYAELAAMLEREVEVRLTRHLQERGKLRQVTVGIVFEPRKHRMVVNFGPGYLPDKDAGYGELFLEPLAADLRRYSERSGLEILDVEFFFQGRPIEEHFPEDHTRRRLAQSRSAHSMALVSSSHGYIALHPGREWEFQRPAPLGLQEDVLSPVYGDALQNLLEQRSGLTVYRARSRSVDPHPESTHPWEHMSARYHLKALLPDRTDIWNELPNSSDSDREVKEDIRARPNYANHLGVDVMLSLHTNGNVDASVRGAEVYCHRTKPQDKALGDSILCGMREIIRAQEGYENFPIRAQSNPGGHGENRIGMMPSVIVETAYHSNPEDVAALQDPVFRAASMKGVEKGYRLFREGKDCTPLKAEPIDGINLSQGDSRQVDVVFEGYPQYPIELITTNVGCPPGWICTGGRVRIETPDAKPSQITLRCENAGSAPVFWNTQVVDDDGVKSPPVRHWVQCIRRPGGAVASPGVPAGVEAATAG
ncbi:TPA: N-acetylmuramoyl-L-alanine amidase [Stenotrophomonas maltophilia]|nr:N-acetylmuramoyl-L-alanine amidase [Stenotrophomonas maltophilia]HDS0951819.1 N-acetylmuramoyl-L-alanine amidase [Stenotrophomonas maltophilia]HDS1024002.1 N-acetylmuramoyl-L-alanine amidase [Stenotrophomonas maltophilia]HDS1028290.1 N-acetylmuramoyl-L-alanine amidase [Stenotrophomonas maltophilia]HDS1029284.1 N-acetylmuramoyl-L-alanine amidase [Stenotrophomonas maltophilia]